MEHEHHQQSEAQEQPVVNDCIHHPFEACDCPPEHRTGNHTDGQLHAHHAEPREHELHDHTGNLHGGHNHAGHDHAGHNHAGHDPRVFRRQFWVSLALTVPTVIWSPMVQEAFGFQAPQFTFSNFVPAAVGTLLLVLCGRVFLKSGVQEIRGGRPGMMALISLALVVSFGYSALVTTSQALHLGLGGMDFWWELAALITIMLLGHWLEMSSVVKAQNAVGELVQLLPDYAVVLHDKIESRVPLNQLKVGDLVVVKPGAVIPADGQVLFGESSVNESMLTGESNALAKKWGDPVIGGTVNAVSAQLGLGELTIKVTALGEASVIGTIAKLVVKAQASKSKAQRLADKAAGWLFYAAILTAALTATLWPILGHQPLGFVLERVVTVLVIACPHALGLAIPLVTTITTAKAAKNGILIRDRIAFEATRKVDVVLFDKTGTLTTGERGVVSAHITRRGALEDIDELFAVAAGLEIGSEHSIAAAILAEVASRKVEPLDVKDLMTTPGVGVSGRYLEYRLFAGGPALLTKNRIDIEVQDLVAADAANSAGHTVIYVVRDAVLLGFIALGDVIRETSADAVYELQRMGKRVAMLTGDAHGVANAVAAKLGIDEVYAEVLPHQKAQVVADIQASGVTVAMVGDGVNDAPALAQANVGIAIGSGTNVAVESAGIVLISDDPLAVADAIALARRSYAKMVQNLWWGAGYNLIAIPLAAGVLFPIGLLLSPAVGAVLMSLSTIIVAANAQLLRKD